jgi:hypothetical protein
MKPKRQPGDHDAVPANAKTDDGSETIDLSASDSVSLGDGPVKSDEFIRGAKWSLRKLALWLKHSKFAADDPAAQHAVDGTVALIARHAIQAAADLRPK